MEIFALIIVIILFIAYLSYKKIVISKRAERIDKMLIPNSIAEKIIEKYPHLSKAEADQVVKGLREYFHITNIAGRKMVAMPSQAVDEAWHEFILFTRQYDHFCKKALGRFLHHTPAEAMESATSAQTSIKTAWKISCSRENIKRNDPSRLPSLFAMDVKLNIPNGFRYSLDCTKTAGHTFCASHIACSSGFDIDIDGDSGCGGGCGGD